jgi:hypothetical protein
MKRWLYKTRTSIALGLTACCVAGMVAQFTYLNTWRERAELTEDMRVAGSALDFADAAAHKQPTIDLARIHDQGKRSREFLTAGRDASRVLDALTRMTQQAGLHVDMLRLETGDPETRLAPRRAYVDVELRRIHVRGFGQFAQVLRFAEMLTDSPVPVEMDDFELRTVPDSSELLLDVHLVVCAAKDR